MLHVHATFLLVISLVASSLIAQEAPTSKAIPVASDLNSSSSTRSAALTNTASTDATSTNKNDVEKNAITDPAAEPSSSVVPTDPSMIPPPESTNIETKESLPNDPSGLPSDSSEEKKAPVASTESIEKKKEQIKVRYYEVRTQAEKEEAIIALRLKADKAASDEEKRQNLRAYYELLFQRMKQIDPSISERCDTMQAAYLRHLEQICIEPTIPLNDAPQQSY
ncbi:MAG: hypothetical protein ACH346_01480 [Chthoniobacterales bacterium]